MNRRIIALTIPLAGIAFILMLILLIPAMVIFGIAAAINPDLLMHTARKAQRKVIRSVVRIAA